MIDKGFAVTFVDVPNEFYRSTVTQVLTLTEESPRFREVLIQKLQCDQTMNRQRFVNASRERFANVCEVTEGKTGEMVGDDRLELPTSSV